MEIMEEGNLMDRVRILLQRDLAYYNEHQKVLQEKVCSTIVGGVLDFPSITTFVTSKLVTWWEESYYLLFRSMSAIFQGTTAIDYSKDEEDNISVGKSITSREFVALISQSSLSLIEHLHILSQEALDHADLSVLTGTIGTAGLIRNTIYVYNQQLMKCGTGVCLAKELKTFQNMAEALAERLLDLHNRLIALYILQDVDCLNWNAEHPFFEGERSSYTVQMWWLYVQGTQEDLWNTMPPKIAERVFSGILNESLTILTSRYTQAKTGNARAPLIAADLSNILLCMFQLLPTISENADEFLGCKIMSNIIRDIHVKCHLLLCCFILRGTPLSVLYKNFKDGFNNIPCQQKNRTNSVQPWIAFVASERNEDISLGIRNSNRLPPLMAIKYELLVLLSRTQPMWPLLLKVLRINDCWIMQEILFHVIVETDESENEIKLEQCKGFLCKDDCAITSSIQDSIVYLLLKIGNKTDIQRTLIRVLEEVPEKWAIYFSHSQIWNQNRPLWIRTLLSFIQPATEHIIQLVTNKMHENSPINAFIAEYIENMASIVDCLPEGVILTASLVENILPPDIIPAGDYVLIQLMCISLYDELGNESPVSEALCRLESRDFCDLQKAIVDVTENIIPNASEIKNDEINEILVSHILNEKAGRASLKVLYDYLKNHADWLKLKLNMTTPNKVKKTLLYKMFYIDDNEYDKVLSGAWIPKWAILLNMPLGLTIETIQTQLQLRPEFWQNIKLSKHDQMVVSHLKSLFVPIIKCIS